MKARFVVTMAESAFWRDRGVLVTGCSGFLGGWLSAWLADAGASVVGIVRDRVPESRFWREGIAERITVVRGDVEDGALLERVLGEYEVQTVMHLAAQTIVGIANRNPLSTFETNIRGTWRLLEACRRSTLVREVIVASSDKAYGTQPRLPYTEGDPLAGEHPYDVSKSCADLLATSYAKSFGLPVAITRCGNFYGGGDLNFNRIVPGTIRSVIRGEPPVIRSDGRLTRDYLYVEDAVLAYVRLAEALGATPDLAGEAFNFSNEHPLSVLELARRILGVMERPDLEPVVLDQATNEIPHQHLAAGKARAHLGWEPRYTLETGLDRTVAWYRAHLSEAGVETARMHRPGGARRVAHDAGARQAQPPEGIGGVAFLRRKSEPRPNRDFKSVHRAAR